MIYIHKSKELRQVRVWRKRPSGAATTHIPISLF